MALKRKRSSPGFSSPASDTTSNSSTETISGCLPFFYAQSKPIEPMYFKPTWSFPTYDDGAEHYRSAADMNSRTRKRHRDDRPEEEAVYCTMMIYIAMLCMSNVADIGHIAANTISRLFNAQRQHPHAEPVLSAETTTARPEQPQRSTLHTFWRIPKRAPAPTLDMPMALDQATTSTTDAGMRCEDCDDPLRSDDAMELDDDTMTQETACMSCKRSVCDRCAVLGNARICLGCASGHER